MCALLNGDDKDLSNWCLFSMRFLSMMRVYSQFILITWSLFEDYDRSHLQVFVFNTLFINDESLL